jgi:hypothetical protein
VIHDRDSIYSKELDAALKTLGLSVLRTRYKSPGVNSFCERLIGTARRECLDVSHQRAAHSTDADRGRHITIMHDRIPAWDRERRIRVRRRRNFNRSGIAYRRIANCSDIHSRRFASRISARENRCITAIPSRTARIHFCGRQRSMSPTGGIMPLDIPLPLCLAGAKLFSGRPDIHPPYRMVRLARTTWQLKAGLHRFLV